MAWTYKNEVIEEIPEGCIGFVYLITNTLSGKKYIGKKLFSFTRSSYKTVTLKNGNKKRKRVKKLVDSDWKIYYGSNDELKADVLKLGAMNFTREILHLCKTKGECSYLELKEQVLRGVLESKEYYNGIIQVKIHQRHIGSLKLD